MVLPKNHIETSRCRPYPLDFKLRKPNCLQMPHVAVLTGDIISSRQAPVTEVDRLMHRLDAAAQETARALGTDPPRFTRFRGDGWQIVVSPAALYLRTTAVLLSGLRLFDIGIGTRVGIGIGAVDRLGTRDLSDASGPAFTRSGHALDSLPRTDRLAIAGLPAPGLAWHGAALDTLAHFSARWSREQAEALLHRLLAETRPLRHIAADLGITRQALSARLAVAGEKPLLALIRAAEATP